MAELILTEDEKAAALWSDLDDDAIGKLVKKKMASLTDHAQQMDRAIELAAAMLLCCVAAEKNATEVTHEIKGLTQRGRQFGDWIVTAKRAR